MPEPKANKLILIILPLAVAAGLFAWYFRKTATADRHPPVSIENFYGLPAYPGSTQTERLAEEENEGTAKLVLTTGDTVPEVIGYYTNAAPAFGWNIDIPPSDSSNPEIQFMNLERNNYEEFVGVSATAEEKGTKISLERVTQKQMQAGEEAEEE